MAIAVEMPKMSDTMEEGVLVSWLVEEGEKVAAGDIIAQVETDKATMDLEVYDDGVLLKKVTSEGDAVPIGGLIAVLGSEGEDISDILQEYSGNGAQSGQETEADEKKEEKKDEKKDQASDDQKNGAERKDGVEKTTSQTTAAASNGRIKASPLARRMADEEDIDLSNVSGSGPHGRIVKRDIEDFLKERPATKESREVPAVETIEEGEAYETVKISQMRKTIARRLKESKFSSPHFYLNVDIDMERSIDVRKRLNGIAERQDRSKISFNDLIVKACSLALLDHPYVNASYHEDEGEIRLYNVVHVAVAVAVDEGLMTPVIRNADRKGLWAISEEVRELAEKARNRTLDLEEMQGSTFTTSNLGMLGIDHFTAIINPPNACILAIGQIRDVPVVRDGEVVPGKQMTVTMSCDHRVVDGATGARFLQTVKQYLEEPTTMLL